MPKPRKRNAARASRQASWLTTLVLVGRSLQAGPAANSVPDHRLDQPAPPFWIRYDRRKGTLEVRNPRIETSSYAASGAGPAPPQAPKLDEAQLANKMFDPANRALRVYAVASGGGSQATGYSPLFAIFNLTFDTANNALRVNCIAGCGMTFGTDISAIDPTHQKVVGLQGRPISSTAPASSNQFLGWNSTSSQWQPQQPSFANLSGTISIPSQLSIFGASGASHAPGAVPDPGAAAGTSRFLREDATWNQVSFAALAGTASASQLPNPTGDVTGTYAATTVTGLHFGATSIPISSTAPASGQCLQYDGTNIVGGTCGSGGAPGGTNAAVQFNNSGAFGGDATNFTYNSTSHTLTVTGTVVANSFTATGNTTGCIQLSPANSANYSQICAATSLGNNTTWTWPATDGSNNQVLTTNGTGVLTWSTPSGVTFGTDISAIDPTHQKVVGLQGRPISSTAPASSNQFLGWNSTSSQWQPQQPSFANLSGTISIPSQLSIFGASGASHAPGAVPDPGAAAGTSRFLREDATWNQVSFAALAGTASASQLPNPTGDVTGTYAATTVTGLHFGATSIPISSTAPASGQCLQYDGTNIVGGTCGSGGAPGGTNAAVQFNNSGAFGGDATNFTYNSTSHTLTVTGTVVANSFTATGNTTGCVQLSPSGSANFVQLCSPTSLGGNTTWTLPASDGTNGQVLVTSGNGVLSFGQVQQIVISKKATATLSANQLVKLDTATAGNVVVTATTDTTNFIGFTAGPISAGTAGPIIVAGEATGILGTGTCSVGQFVIVDTTTAGDVKCTNTFTAGTIIGFAETSQSTVGGTLTVLIDKR